MAFSIKAGGHDVISEINVTPLVDVALVLLVLFFATAPLLSSAVTLDPAKAASDSALQPPKTIVVSVDEDGKIAIDRIPVELAALEAQLKQLSAGSEVSLRLDADEGVNYGIVAKAIAAIERAGIERLSVMTASE